MAEVDGRGPPPAGGPQHGPSGLSPPRPAVSAIIINYNGRAFLDALLASLRNQSFRDFETIFVDNASTDGSADYVRNNWPDVRLLVQHENSGFAKAGNRAAARARGRYLAFLNTDIELDRQWLVTLVETAQQNAKIAAVACKLFLYGNDRKLNGVGGCMNRIGYTWDRGMFEPDRGQYDNSEDVFFASAGAGLFVREHFLAAGGFDEKFFMYHEDVDLCWRLWLMGFRTVTAPAGVAWHHFGGTTRREKGILWREVLGERHSIRTLIKNYGFANLVSNLFRLLLVGQPPRRKLLQLGNFATNLLWLPDTLTERRKIQRARRRTDQDLQRLVVQSDHVPVRL